MINPKPVKLAGRQPLQHQFVRVGKNLWILHPQSYQSVDVKEAPITKIAAGRSPIGEPEVLPFEQSVERRWVLIHLLDDSVDRGATFRILVQQSGDQLPENRFVTVAAAQAGVVDRSRQRQL